MTDDAAKEAWYEYCALHKRELGIIKLIIQLSREKGAAVLSRYGQALVLNGERRSGRVKNLQKIDVSQTRCSLLMIKVASKVIVNIHRYPIVIAEIRIKRHTVALKNR